MQLFLIFIILSNIAIEILALKNILDILEYIKHMKFLYLTREQKHFNSDLIFSYNNIKNDFNNTVLSLCSVLGFEDISIEEILEIKNTSIQNMRRTAKEGKSNYYPELGNMNYKMFRKGSYWRVENITIKVI